MKSTALVVAIMTVGVLATTLTVAARHRPYHGSGAPIGKAQDGKPTGDSNHATGDKGSGKTFDGKSPPSWTDEIPPAGLDLSITVFQGRGRNFHTTKDSHDPKGGLTGNSHDPKGGPTGKPNVFTAPPNRTMPGTTPHYVHHQPRFLAKPGGGTHRNAIGALVVDHGKVGEHRDPPPVGGEGSGAWHGDGKPHIPDSPSKPSNPEDVGDHHLVHSVHEPTSPIIPDGPAVINGATFHHPWSGPGTIGGPVKFVSGALNGTGFHPHHP